MITTRKGMGRRDDEVGREAAAVMQLGKLGNVASSYIGCATKRQAAPESACTAFQSGSSLAGTYLVGHPCG